MRARRATSGRAAIAGLAALLAACGAEPVRVKPVPRAPPPPQEEAQKATWAPIAVAPRPEDARWKLATPAGDVVLDRGGVRWILEREPRCTGIFEDFLPASVTWMVDLGLLAFGTDGRTRRARKATDPFEDLGPFPAGADVVDPLLHRGGVVLRASEQHLWSADGRAWQPLAPLGDRWLHDARIGRDGQGLGLFFPQALARTADGGKSWQPIADPGRMVDRLIGGVDAIYASGPVGSFGLAWSPGSAAMQRRPAATDMATIPWMADAGLRGGGGSNDARQIRGEVLERVSRPLRHRGKAALLASNEAAIDGDDLVAVVRPPRGLPWLGRGKLGEGMVWRRVDALVDACDSGSTRRVAACGGTVAVACDRKAVVEHPSGTRTIALPRPAIAIAFMGPRKVAVITDEAERSVMIDVATGRTEGLGSVKLHEGKGIARPPATIGACADGPSPIVWLVDRADVWKLAKGTLSRVKRLEDRSQGSIVGVDPTGRLVLGNRRKQTLAMIDPDGGEITIELPFSVGAAPYLAGLAGGHGLLLDEQGHVHQSDDGGISWTRAGDPPAVATLDPNGLVCGDTRCEIDDAAARIGWERDEGTGLGDAADPADRRPPQRPAGAASRGRGQSHLDCEIDPTLDPQLGDKAGSITALGIGLGGAVWSATASLAPGGGATTKIASVFWLPNGKVFTRSLSSRPLRQPSLRPGYGYVSPSGAAPWPFVGLVEVAPEGDEKRGHTASLLWDPGPRGQPIATALRAKEAGGDYLGSTLRATLLGGDGFAVVDDFAGVVRWIRGGAKAESRPLRDAAFAPSARDALAQESSSGAIARAPDGRWIVAASPARARTSQSGGTNLPPRVTLISIASDGTWKRREIAVLGVTAASGVGLVEESGGVSLVLVERVSADEVELRLRAIGPDLDLGPARAIPGSRARADGLAPLASCAPDDPARSKPPLRAAGAAAGEAAARVMVVHPDSGVTRFLRVSRGEACVESTWQGELMIPGNGDGAGVALYAEALHGVRCRVPR